MNITSVQNIRYQDELSTCTMNIWGHHFTPGSHVDITITNWPGVDGNVLETARVDGIGDFTVFPNRPLVHVPINETLIRLIVTAHESGTAWAVTETYSPESMVIRE